MTPVLIPGSRTIFLVSHDRVNIFGGSEVFASPFQGLHLCLGRVIGIHAAAFPGACENFGADRLELIKNLPDFIVRDILTFDQVFDLLFRCTLFNVSCQLAKSPPSSLL